MLVDLYDSLASDRTSFSHDEDSSSLNSTISVLPKKGPASTSSFSSFPQKRKVNFAPNKAMYTSCWNREDIASRWYSAEDYASFKTKIFNFVATVTEAEEAHNPFAYTNVLERVYKECTKSAKKTSSGDLPTATILNDKLSVAVQRWSDIGVCRLGLERLICRRIALQRKHLMYDVVDAVLYAQVAADLAKLEGNERAEHIAKACTPRSRESCLFARELALASASDDASPSIDASASASANASVLNQSLNTRKKEAVFSW